MISAFPYPGGKTPYINDIIQYFPDHNRYVEPFGGSAAILLNKPESYVEVFNDADDDVVQFFRVARERRDELEEWLRCVPFSKTVHKEWSQEFFNGYRPDYEIERAGRWFSLRYMQFGGKLDGPSGFKRSGKRNEARSFRGGIDGLDDVIDRLQYVTIECDDYERILERYDDPNTFFYLDPPYHGPGDDLYTHEGAFDHQRLFDNLFAMDADWMVSYGKLPEVDVPRGSIDDLVFEEFTAMYSLAQTEDDGRQKATERLVMNYNPYDTASFAGADQSNLEAFGD